MPLLVVAAVAVAARLYVMVRAGGVFGIAEYDDGVHYGAASLLLHGVLPYRGQVFLQPPGVEVLLAPFGVVGRVAGDASGLATARVATCILGGVTAWLTGRLATERWGRAAGLAAATVQATAAASLLAESTVMLEPYVNLLTVSALFVLSRLDTAGRSTDAAARAAAAGALLAAATTVKAWGAVTLLVVMAWLAVRRRALLWPALMGAAVAAVTICLPFLLAAPAAMVHDVIVTQLSRPHDGIGPVASRLADMVGVRTLLRGHPLGVAVTAATLGVGVIVTGVAATRRDGFARLLVAVFGAGVLMLLLAPVFFTHYTDYLVPFVALLTGAAVGTVASQRAGRSPARLAAVAAVVIAVAGLQVTSATARATPSSVTVAALRAAVPATGCVLTETPTLAEMAGTLTRGHCPVWLDPRGSALAAMASEPAHRFSYPAGFRGLGWWQSRWLRWASRSSAVVVVGDPCGHAIWTPTVCRYITARFPRSTVVGTHSGTPNLPVEVWSRESSGR